MTDLFPLDRSPPLHDENFEQLCKRLEHWETDAWAAQAILNKEILTDFVVDPCAGTGVLSEAAKNYGYPVASYDIHDWDYSIKVMDWLDVDKPPPHWPDIFTVFMNPPFSKAVEFVEKSMDLGARKIVCFQRFVWWESRARRDFWEKHPPNRIYICGDRANCHLHSTPLEQRSSMSAAHAWFVWEKGHPPGTLVGHIYKAP